MLFYPLMIAGGLFWALAYLMIIRRGFLDGTYGMPVAALCANISWEFVFSFIFPHGPIQTPINAAWFVLDLVILGQIVRYGPREFSALPRRSFYAALIAGLLTALAAVVAITVEFQDFDGAYTAFGMNLMMSVLFLWMLYSRGSLRGQSPWIGVAKMVGTACNSAAFWLYASEGSVLLPFLFVAILLFDAAYVFFAFRLRRTKSAFASARAVG
jgi:hypothetical protein